MTKLNPLRLGIFAAASVAVLSGCSTTGTNTAATDIHQFDPVPTAQAVAGDLEPVEPKSINELLAEADAAFKRANEAQEKGDYEAALRNYNYMLELMIQADLDPAVFYNLRGEFNKILDTTTYQAHFYDRGRIREWTREDYERMASTSDLHIPMPIPDRVHAEIEKIQHAYPKNFQRGLDRSFQYLPYIRAEFAKAGLPQDLVWLAMVESQFHPRVTSRVGAGGMWQFMPSTGKRFGLNITDEVDDRYNWEKSTKAAIEYLKILHGQFGAWELAVSAYNRGEGGLERVLAQAGGDTNWWRVMEHPEAGAHIPLETKEFYPKLLASIIVAKNPEKYGFTINSYTPEPTTRVAVNGRYALSDLNAQLGLGEGTLEALNPDLTRRVTPARGEFMLAVPASVGARVAVALKEAPQGAAVRLASNTASAPAASPSAAAAKSNVTHVVRRGETLSVISQKYGVPVATIMSANKIKSASRLRAGQRLNIPVSGAKASSRTQNAAAAPETKAPAPEAPAEGAPAPAPAPEQGDGWHEVKSGDTLSTIATKYGVEVSDLQDWNAMGSSTTVMVNQKLKVAGGASTVVAKADAPSAATTTHTVKPGEYPAKIASTYGVRTADVLAWNGLTPESTIQVGQKLLIYPGGAAAERRAAPPEPKKLDVVTHKVAKGESASVIASKYGVSLKDFMAWNDLTSKSVLKVGQSVTIRRGGDVQLASAKASSGGEKLVHVVAKGQSPWTIAKQYGVSVDELYSWNGWTKAPVLQVGTRITVYKSN